MLTEEEIKKLQDENEKLKQEKEAAETAKTEAEEAKTAAETAKTEAEAAKEKAEADLVSVKRSAGHFRKLSEMNDEEKAKLSEKERDLLEREEKLAEEKAGFRDEITRQMSQRENMRRWVGNDSESEKKMQEAYDKLNMPDGTPEEVASRFEEAAKIAGIQQAEPPVSIGGGQGPQSRGNKSFAETEKGKEMAEKMWPDDSNPITKEETKKE